MGAVEVLEVLLQTQADLEMPSIPLNLTDILFPLLRRNHALSAFVQPELPVGVAVVLYLDLEVLEVAATMF